MTPDGNPIVGEVDGLENYVLAVGMCGQGYMLGPGLAVYLRHLITKESDMDRKDSQELLKPLTLYRDFGKNEALK